MWRDRGIGRKTGEGGVRVFMVNKGREEDLKKREEDFYGSWRVVWSDR